MFGKNPVRRFNPDLYHLRVQEVFTTIQGEGPFAGRPAIFLRLAGCNLRCSFCDTDFESNWENRRDTELVVRDLNEALDKAPGATLLVITGGEPLLQNLNVLLAAVAKDGRFHHVQIETAGTIWLEGLEDHIKSGLVSLVCSPKTPRLDIRVECYCAHYKYIIRAGDNLMTTTMADGLPMRSPQTGVEQFLFRPRADRPHTIWVQPCDEGPDQPAKNKANLDEAVYIAVRFGHRVSLQLHKILGLP